MAEKRLRFISLLFRPTICRVMFLFYFQFYSCQIWLFDVAVGCHYKPSRLSTSMQPKSIFLVVGLRYRLCLKPLKRLVHFFFCFYQPFFLTPFFASKAIKQPSAWLRLEITHNCSGFWMDLVGGNRFWRQKATMKINGSIKTELLFHRNSPISFFRYFFPFIFRLCNDFVDSICWIKIKVYNYFYIKPKKSVRGGSEDACPPPARAAWMLPLSLSASSPARRLVQCLCVWPSPAL